VRAAWEDPRCLPRASHPSAPTQSVEEERQRLISRRVVEEEGDQQVVVALDEGEDHGGLSAFLRRAHALLDL